MGITFLQMAQKVLVEEKQPLSVSEIWQVVTSKGYDRLLDSTGKTPWATLGAQIYIDVRDNPSSFFLPVGTRPKRFILKEQADILQQLGEIIENPKIPKKKIGYSEKDLHPLLVYYGFNYLRAYLKTINHTKSCKKSLGEWVHPDIVGYYFPFRDWKIEVFDVSTIMGNTALKLYSFELKRELSLGNLRESFFQAVSNSSWANEGYLVAAEIDIDEGFRIELKRLSTAFGIGIIQLDVGDPDSSEIVLPARIKEYVDWDTVNKLSEMNPEFCKFLQRIKKDMTIKEVNKNEYDPVMSKEDLINSFRFC